MPMLPVMLTSQNLQGQCSSLVNYFLYKTYSCKVAKFFIPLLNRLVFSIYILIDSFSFVQELLSFNRIFPLRCYA